MMGGEIGVSSTEGVGSEFWVELAFGRLVQKTRSPKTSLRGFDRLGLRGIRVLVVDDSEINLEVAQRILELEGALVTLAPDGRVATDLLAASPRGFDIVLMDVQMPVLDGYGAAREIRRRLGLTGLPIIALTAGTMSSEHQLALEAGMDDFMSKPFVPRALVECIRKHVEMESRSVVSVPPVPVESQRVASWPAIDGIDAEEVSARLMGDVSLFRLLLAQMLEQFADVRSAIVSHGDADAAPLAARLHKLKGTAATLGARALAQVASEAEVACRAGQSGSIERALPIVIDGIDALGKSIALALEAEKASPTRLGVPTERAELTQLLMLLDAFDVSAIARFEELAKGLEGLFATNEVRALRASIGSLQFEAVSARIRERMARPIAA